MKNILVVLILMTGFLSCNNSANPLKPNEAIREMTASEAHELIQNNNDVFLIILRTPREIKGGLIDNAITIDFKNSNFKSEIAQLDKEKTYLIYCKAGGRSSKVCKAMNEMGFKNLINMKGGYTEYRTLYE